MKYSRFEKLENTFVLTVTLLPIMKLSLKKYNKIKNKCHLAVAE